MNEFDVQGWRPATVATLVYIVAGEHLFLIRKMRGHGAGKVNGPGGKVESGETPLAGVVRECREETGVTPIAPVPMIELRFLDSDEAPLLGIAFRALAFVGTPQVTAEAEPFWCPLAELPYDEMWVDDGIWLPRLIAGEPLRAEFVTRSGQLIDHRVTPVPAAYLQRLAHRPVP
jgi:8-oxo-dGTP diphosphatase